jgi:hypothetical protein
MAITQHTAPPEPSRETTVAGFPDLYVSCRSYSWRPGYALVQYSGWAEGLVGAGILSRRALQIGRPKIAKHRTDADGGRWLVSSHFKKRSNGRRARWYQVHCVKPMVHLEKLPGAAQALDADTTHCAWEAEREAWRDRDSEATRARWRELGAKVAAGEIDVGEPFLQALRRLERPTLRLVVDNTRDTPPRG